MADIKIHEIKFDNGKVKQKLSLKNSVLDGESFFYNESGQIQQRLNYSEGKLNGESDFYTNGKIYAKKNFLEGKLNGEANIFDDSGQKSATINYKNDLKEGIASYFSQGQCVREANYRSDKLNGKVFDFSQSGILVQETNYKDGLIIGELRRYWSNGNIMEITEFTNGQQTSASKFFNEDGSPDKFVSVNRQEDGFSEYKYTAENTPQFNGFSIKIVMSSTDQSEAPRIKNFRAIALRSFDSDEF